MTRNMLMVLVSGVAMGACFTGCGPAGQPRVFRVAIDTSPITSLTDPQCFTGNMPNVTDTVSEVAYRQEAIWVVWDAAEGKQYLDMGNTRFKMGDSPQIEVTDLIEGANNTFSGNRQELTRGLLIEQRSTGIVTTFNDLNATPSGTISLNAQYQCQDGSLRCPNEPAQRSCRVSLKFLARKIDVQQTTVYAPTGSGITATTR
jgi:hypothetical protein